MPAVPENAVVFVAQTGEMIVYLTDMPLQDGDVLISSDGKTFYALVVKGFGGNTEEHRVSFQDPHHDVGGKLQKDGDSITFDGKTFTCQEMDFGSSEVIPLPNTRRVEYVYRLGDGRIVLVTASEHHFSYESFRLYIGNGVNMREIPVQRVERYRDGGTTFIHTREGVFFSPSPFADQSLSPTWDGQSMELLDKDAFVVEEVSKASIQMV